MTERAERIEGEKIKAQKLAAESEQKKAEYDALLNDMEQRISSIDDADERDLLIKRYLEFKTWATIAAEFGYSEQSIYRLHARAVKKLRVRESS